jgi:hypothetical protein
MAKAADADFCKRFVPIIIEIMNRNILLRLINKKYPKMNYGKPICLLLLLAVTLLFTGTGLECAMFGAGQMPVARHLPRRFLRDKSFGPQPAAALRRSQP